MAFKDRVRELRKAKGWGQKELAAKAGVKQATVAGWESGRHEVNPTHREELCKIFGVTIGFVN